MELKSTTLGLNKGETPPDFTLKKLDGGDITLSDLKGKKVVLNFWATWCPPCKAEMPSMQKYYEDQAKIENVEIIAVNLTYTEKNSKNILINFINYTKIKFSVFMMSKIIHNKKLIYPNGFRVFRVNRFKLCLGCFK